MSAVPDRPWGVTVSTLVRVDPATAFGVFTDEVDAWWKTGPAYRFGGRRAGTMRFERGAGAGRLVEAYPDGEVYEVGRILAWEPVFRLAFEFRGPNFQPDQRTEVEVRFEAVSGGTRVTVEHTGWDRLPADHPVRHGLPEDEFARMWGGWWHGQLTALRFLSRPG